MNGRKSNYKDNGIVKIKPNAYYKMLVHVLRYGATSRDKSQYKEVMGMLIGRLEGDEEIKNVIIEDAVPVSHGGSIEVSFAPEDYVTFSMIDEQYSKKNWFTVGWYHSHPGLDIFFSSTDIQNQLGWQTANPSAIGIVFDHTYLERQDDLGFRTFRLDDPSKGMKTDYHEVETIVEPPDEVNYYSKLMNLIESVHTKEAPILEINEAPSLFGDIMIPSEEKLKARKPNLDYSIIYSSLKDAFTAFIERGLTPLIEFLNQSSQEIIKNVVTTNLRLRENIANLKTDLTDGLKEIQNSVKNQLTNKINQIDILVEENFEDLKQEREEVKFIIKNIKQKLTNEVDEILNNRINQEIQPLFDILRENSNLIREINNILTEKLEVVNRERQKLEQNSEMVGNLSDIFQSKFSELEEKYNYSLDKSLQPLSAKLNKIKENDAELIDSVKESSQLLNEKRNEYQERIETIEKKNEELDKKVKNLSSENKGLKSNLEEKEEENKDMKKSLGKLRGEKMDLTERVDILNEEKKKLEEEIKRLRKERKNLNKQLEKRTKEG
ncbi:MAG: hypothetical protein BAJALOKI2v1_890007 [Promethearchaeota archaeon]|nr:MAG: hypothetical protein BAJALOKI2v1_890007 [Candidatus Lokiarchaeota archaeon]